MNAVEHNRFTEALGELGARLPRPKAVCVVSAHWVTTGSRVMSSAHPETIHDFYGFPRPLYAVQYSAPGAPQEANQLGAESCSRPRPEVGTRSWRVERAAAHVPQGGCADVSVESG